MLASVVTTYLCLLRSVLSMGPRLTFVFFQSLSAVLLPISMVHFFSIVFVVGRFVPKVFVGILQYIVLPREMISVLSCYPVVLVSVLLPLFVHSA